MCVCVHIRSPLLFFFFEARERTYIIGTQSRRDSAPFLANEDYVNYKIAHVKWRRDHMCDIVLQCTTSRSCVVLSQALRRIAETSKIVEGGLRKRHGRLILIYLALGRMDEKHVRENRSLALHVNQEIRMDRGQTSSADADGRLLVSLLKSGQRARGIPLEPVSQDSRPSDDEPVFMVR